VSALRTGVPRHAAIVTGPAGVHRALRTPRTAVPAPVVVVSGLDGVRRQARR
jgi:hypothetical protein